MKQQLKAQFKQMRNILIVQEQTTEAILLKNLTYVEKELKGLQAIDYKKFEEAERWLKTAKVKLDNFQANNNNPNYIAFDMLEGAKQNQQDDGMNNEDFLLVEDGNRNIDIITHGERIADTIGKVKTIQPSLLASQLANLKLTFEEDVIKSLNNVSKCIAIEGVEVSNEELDALTEAAKAKAEAENVNDI